jgi:hypothetical protein
MKSYERHFLEKVLTGRIAFVASLLSALLNAKAADPRVDSWFSANSGKYARIYSSTANRTSGISTTTWTGQSLPAYAGVQAIYSSATWTYIKTTGLGGHTMGPWNNPNLPKNQGTLYRFPRTPAVPASKTLTGLGAIGFFVDGVAIYNTSDGFSYSYANAKDATPIGAIGPGDGIWNRDAWPNELVSFDNALAHNPQNGQYHAHANPIATRYFLGDNVLFAGTPDNNSPKTYSEDTNTTAFKHSPIIGWAADGFPIYGPYGYDVALDAGSTVRRMISGYVLRDGNYGTTNLNVTGRTTLPAWAALAQNRSAVLSGTQYGPSTSYTSGSGPTYLTYTLGHYAEDYDYLGDHGFLQGVTNIGGLFFDLNQYNVRYCVTPEFPAGTYAYFVTIKADGTPVYPYNIGRWYFGSPSGGVTSLSEAVTTNFVGGANSALRLNTPEASNGVVTLTWSATEGGTYRVESTGNWTSWTTNASGIPAVLNQGTVTSSVTTNQFFRVARTALTNYDTN